MEGELYVGEDNYYFINFTNMFIHIKEFNCNHPTQGTKLLPEATGYQIKSLVLGVCAQQKLTVRPYC